MAKRVEPITLGIDVAKDTFVIFNWHTQQLRTIANHSDPIKRFLGELAAPVRIAVEPTSHYHLTLIKHAQRLGFTIYLVNPRQLVHYRQAVGQRHKTDPHDAWLLARFLMHEAQQLRPFRPQGALAQRLWTLLKRRATVVNARKQLQQSLQGIQLGVDALFQQFQSLIKYIDQSLIPLVKQLHWDKDYRRC